MLGSALNALESSSCHSPYVRLLVRTFSAFQRTFFSVVFCSVLFCCASIAQNQVLGEIQLVGKTKADKTSEVWVDGQYLGYVNELKDDKKILLLPDEHEIIVRQSGYTDFSQKLTVEPRKKTVLKVVMVKDPRAQFPKVWGVGWPVC
jgi:hypothetical protein